MNRWAIRVGVGVVLVSTVAAEAAAPIPKRRPILDAAPDPQSAISRLMQADDGPLGTSVAAYAPSATAAPELRARTDEVALYLVGKLAPNGGPIGDGLTWRIFREMPAADGALPLITKAAGGDLDVRLKPGRYIVHVSYGRATVARTIDVRDKVNSETFVLNAGGLQLAARLETSNAPVSDSTSFELYRIDGEERELIGPVKAGAIARLPAGSYHVISKYGDVNAVRTADVTVEPGKLTRVTLAHQAGTVSLRLARDVNGEALADTAWHVVDANGQEVFERVGAHASVTLAAGAYEVVARHRNNEFRHRIDVRSGDNADVVVLADTL